MSSVSINGIAIGYEDEGRGEPLVLVHGHPFDRSMWRPQIHHFSGAGWRVIAPDLRGYGESGLRAPRNGHVSGHPHVRRPQGARR